MARFITLVALAVATLAVPRLAHAQWGNPGIDFTDTLERDIMYDRIRSSPNDSSTRSAPARSTSVAKRAVARIPAMMAADGPADKRAALTQEYELLLSTYETLAAKLKLPDHDLAGALALFICGSYVAYHGTDISNAALLATSRQLHEMLGHHAAFAKLTTDQKQDMYEQLAILSTTMVLGRERAMGDQAQLAQVRALGRQYLAGFVDPDRLQITDRGIGLAPRTR